MAYHLFKNQVIYCDIHKVSFSDKCPKCSTRQNPIAYGTDGDLGKKDNPTHVLGGRVGVGYSCYIPHNARFYFNFDKFSFNPSFEFKNINSGAELILESFMGCSFRIKRSSVEVVNKVDSKRVFRIEGSASERKVQVDNAIGTLRFEVIKALKCLIGKYGGVTDFVPFKSWIPDNKITNDRIIDSVPRDVTWRDDVSKKVYVDSNVEFADPLFAANYFRNVGLNDFVPEIVNELKGLRDNQNVLNSAFDRFTIEALNPLTEQIKTHLEVQRSTLELHKDMTSTLRDIRDNANSPNIREDTSNSFNSVYPPNSISVVDLDRAEKVRKLKAEWGW